MPHAATHRGVVHVVNGALGQLSVASGKWPVGNSDISSLATDNWPLTIR
jgi:hypothetical protein